jgi:hypothetical protein
LDTVYVWHGKGSTPSERIAALAYAQNLAVAGNITELFEGVNDDDEMFWMILGSDEYAKADHWRWRANTTAAEPKLWRYDESLAPHQASHKFRTVHTRRSTHPTVHFHDRSTKC